MNQYEQDIVETYEQNLHNESMLVETAVETAVTTLAGYYGCEKGEAEYAVVISLIRRLGLFEEVLVKMLTCPTCQGHHARWLDCPKEA